MSIIYLENQYQINSELLADIDCVEQIPHFAEVHESLQAALEFAWQWIRGENLFQQSTSGSTGSPKKIYIHRDQMVASAQLTIEALKLSSADSSLLCLPAQYIGGKMMIVRSLLVDMDTVFVRPTSNFLPYLPFIPAFSAMVPLQVQTLLDTDSASSLNHMKAVIIGGAPVSDTLEKRILHQLTIPVYSTYGMTETVSHIALRKLTNPEASDSFHVLGDTKIATDERGCLKIHGKVTQGKWIVTNDLIKISGSNQFQWLGRYDSVINSGGVKVIPEQLEELLEPILKNHHFDGRFLVSSLPDDTLGERIVLLLEGSSLDRDWVLRVLAEVRQQLPRYRW